jgi:hypothetical protein
MLLQNLLNEFRVLEVIFYAQNTLRKIQFVWNQFKK